MILYGAEKGKILADALWDPIKPQNPASFLRTKGVGEKVTIFLDKAAADQVISFRDKLVASI
jgi:6-phosphogluconolactonase/glucosamine-6-phosphate isomerase/deaminase